MQSYFLRNKIKLELISYVLKFGPFLSNQQRGGTDLTNPFALVGHLKMLREIGDWGNFLEMFFLSDLERCL